MGATNFAYGKKKANTFIGGVSATISTPTLLASKLAISVTRIKSFQIVGVDIKCRIIGGGYALPANAFNGNTSITYYNDEDGLVASNVSGNGFFNASNLTYLYLPKIVTLGYRFCSGCTSLTEVFLPDVLTAGWEDFEGCINLINIGSSFQKMTSIGNRTFYNCSKITSLNLPNVGVVSSNTVSACFFGMTNLTYLNIPNLTSSVASPTSNHFSNMIYGCVNLTTAIFTNLNYIGQSFADNASSLVNLDLSNVTKACLGTSFRNTTSLSNLIMPNITTIVGSSYWCFLNSKVNNVDFSKITNHSLIDIATFESTTGLVSLNLTCYTTNLGSTALNNNILYLIKTGCTITVSTALSTNNAGNPDGDLQYAISSRGATVIYV